MAAANLRVVAAVGDVVSVQLGIAGNGVYNNDLAGVVNEVKLLSNQTTGAFPADDWNVLEVALTGNGGGWTEQIFPNLKDQDKANSGVRLIVGGANDAQNGKSPGQPHFSWGFLPTMDDLAKITDLMHRRGVENGVPILHQRKMRDYFVEGTKKPIGGFMMGSGYQDYQDPADGNRNWLIPAPGGMGGNQVVLMPNRTTALRFAKNGSPSPESMITASNNLRPFKDFR